jgi:hypothetical protein
MVRHIVLFRLDEALSQDEKNKIFNEFKKNMEKLPSIIPTVRSLTVGQNVNGKEKWDVCLNTTFDNLKDVQDYGVNPDHKAASAIIRANYVERACVDYEE